MTDHQLLEALFGVVVGYACAPIVAIFSSTAFRIVMAPFEWRAEKVRQEECLRELRARASILDKYRDATLPPSEEAGVEFYTATLSPEDWRAFCRTITSGERNDMLRAAMQASQIGVSSAHGTVAMYDNVLISIAKE